MGVLYIPGSARELIGLVIGDGGATQRRRGIDVNSDSRNSSTAKVSET